MEVARRILQAFANEVAAPYGNPSEPIACLTKIQQVEGIYFGAGAGLGEPVSAMSPMPRSSKGGNTSAE